MTPVLKLLPSVHLRRGTQRHLDAAAADVDHDRRVAADVHAIAGRQVNQAWLLRCRR